MQCARDDQQHVVAQIIDIVEAALALPVNQASAIKNMLGTTLSYG